MLQLKESTQKQHDATEAGSFNDDLVKGRLPREKYVESLEQLFLIHRALEAKLKEHRGDNQAINRVLRDHYFQEPYLCEDLGFFGRDVHKITPLPATRSFIETIDKISISRPIGLLGILYVLEGSNNGSKFISRAVNRAYGLTNGQGTRYLDPYGDQQKQFWQDFKSDMNAIGFSAQDADVLVQTAGQTFEAIMQFHRELNDATCSAPTAAPQAAVAKCPFHRAN
jgi:heme oxygenase